MSAASRQALAKDMREERMKELAPEMYATLKIVRERIIGVSPLADRIDAIVEKVERS